MSCKNQGVIGKIVNISQPAIVKGSDAFISTQLVYQGDVNTPVKIPGFIGATGFLANDDTTVQAVTGTLDSADLGTLNFSIAASGTDLLKAGDEQSFEFRLEDADGVQYIQFDGGLQIKDRLF